MGGAGRLSWALFLLLLVICFGLGYSTLNRYDPSLSEGVGDSLYYFQMARGEGAEVLAPYRYRILIPGLAAGLLRLLAGVDVGSWNRTALALLAVNALLVALTGLLLLRMALRLRVRPGAALLAPFLYVTGFTIPNGHLSGLVDAGEGFAVVALGAALAAGRMWLAPLILAVGVLAKESALVIGTAFLAGWMLRHPGGPRVAPRVIVTLGSAGIGLAVLLLVRRVMGGASYEYHVLTAERLAALPREMLNCLASRSMVYTLALLLPLAILSRRSLPRALTSASLAAAGAALLLGGYAAITENFARPLYNALGPLAALGAALTLNRLLAEAAPD